MFSLTFELVSMLAQCFRIRNSMFRFLPNPTADAWLGDVSKLSWPHAMASFQERLKPLMLKYEHTPTPNDSFSLLRNIESHWRKMDSFAKWDPDKKAQDIKITTREHIHDLLDITSKYFNSHLQSHDIASVVVSHLGAVLRASDELEATITELGAADPALNIIEYYFDKILPQVENEGLNTGEAARHKRGTIWIALVCRMICWSLLHDFDVADVNICDSRFVGSRMPVFIG